MIACVARHDLDRVGQVPVGGRIRFRAVRVRMPRGTGRAGDPAPVRAVAAALQDAARRPARPSRRTAATFLGRLPRGSRSPSPTPWPAGGFEDPAWVSPWDEVFAELFLDAHDADLAGRPVPRPWRLAFAADPAMHPLGHLLLAMNAHINFDLPRSILAVVSDADFADPALLARRDRDHQRIDEVLFDRLRAEDADLGWKAPAGRPRARAGAPVGVAALPAGVPGEGLAQHRRSSSGPARRGRTRSPTGSASSTC